LFSDIGALLMVGGNRSEHFGIQICNLRNEQPNATDYCESEETKEDS
jgi:hypothetical protein